MKYIKVFDSFFRYFKFSTITNTKEIWGYTREEFEDFFVFMADEYSLSISIDFMYFTRGGLSYETTDGNVRTLLNNYKSGKIIPGITITFCSSESLNKRLLGGVTPEDDCSNLSVSDLNLYKENFEKLESEIEDFMVKLKNRINYKIVSQSSKSKINVQNIATIQRGLSLRDFNGVEKIGSSISTYNIQKLN